MSDVPNIKEEEMVDDTAYPTPSSAAAAAATNAGATPHYLAMVDALNAHHLHAAEAAHDAAVAAVVAAGGAVAAGSALAPIPVPDDSEDGDPVRRAFTLGEMRDREMMFNQEYVVLFDLAGHHALQALVPHERDPVGALIGIAVDVVDVNVFAAPG